MYKVQDPLIHVDSLLLRRVQQAQNNSGIPHHDALVQHWAQLTDSLSAPEPSQPKLAHRRPESTSVKCEVCGQEFQDLAAYRFHHTKVHLQRTREEQKDYRKQMIYRDSNFMHHAIGGLPHCRHCGRKFSAWTNFMSHFNRQCWPVLHLGEVQPEHLRELPPEPIPLLHDPDARSAAQQLTLDHFAEWIASKQRAHHCPVCNLWLTKPRWMRVHLQQQHAEYKAHLPTIDKRLKALGSSARQCGWCDTRHDRGRAACAIYLTAALIQHVATHTPDPPNDTSQASRAPEGTARDESMDGNDGLPGAEGTHGDQRHGQKGQGSRSGAGHRQTPDEEPKARERPRKAKPKTRGQRQLQQPPGRSGAQEPPQAGEPDSSTVTTTERPTGHMAPGPLLRDLPSDGSTNHGGAATPPDWSQMAGEAIGSSCIAWPSHSESPSQCPSSARGRASAEPAQAQRGATDACHEGRQLKLHELRIQPQVPGGEGPNPHPPATDGRSPPRYPPLHARSVSTRSCSSEGLRPLRHPLPPGSVAPCGRLSPRTHSEDTSGPDSGAGYPLIALRLGNRSNYCYANSFVVLLMFVGLPSYDIFPAQLAPLFNRLVVGPGRHLWDDLIWRSLLAQWRRPSQQNDAAKFVTHLFLTQDYLPPRLHWSMQARLHEDEMSIRDTGDAWPLVINEPTDNPTNTQVLIRAWHTQAHRHALSNLADLILLQLNRSVRTSRQRNHVPVEITPVISVSSLLQ